MGKRISNNLNGNEGGGSRRRLRLIGAAAVAGLALVPVGVIGASDGPERPERADDIVHAQAPTVSRSSNSLRWNVSNSPDAASGAGTAPADCNTKQPDEGYFYLPVFTAPGEYELTCTVELGRRVLVNLGGYLCWPTEESPEETLREDCRTTYDAVPNLVGVWLDGRELASPTAATLGPLTIEVAEGNAFDLPAGLNPFVYVGKDLEIAGLGEGEHTIRTYNRAIPSSEGQFDVTMTFHLNVVDA